MIGSGFSMDLMKHHIAVTIASASCAAKIAVGSATGLAVGGTGLACAALVLIAEAIPVDRAPAAPARGPGREARTEFAAAFDAVLEATFALFCAAIELPLAAVAAALLSAGVVIV